MENKAVLNLTTLTKPVNGYHTDLLQTVFAGRKKTRRTLIYINFIVAVMYPLRLL
jgi:hypothetical protein